MSMSSSVAVEIGSVYWALDGGIHHASCGQRMVLRARHPDELVFACVACSESVAVPVSVLSRIPVAT
jgi:hypothetical protein